MNRASDPRKFGYKMPKILKPRASKDDASVEALKQQEHQSNSADSDYENGSHSVPPTGGAAISPPKLPKIE